MRNAEAVLSVKFNSAFNAEQLLIVCQQDLEVFRNVPGLLQKYYLSEESTGAISGIYIFESRSARSAFWLSDLAKDIPKRYAMITETIRIEEYEMAIVLNDVLLA